MVELELLDVFDENFVFQRTASRHEVHSCGLWHQTVHCWIIGRLAGEPCVLFQRRSPHKDWFPDMLDVTAAGHLLSGETPSEAVREVEEELGVFFPYTQFMPLGLRLEVSAKEGAINREFAHVFFIQSNLLPSQYRLQSSEVSGLFAMPVADGLRFFSGEVESVGISGLYFGESGKPECTSCIATWGDIPPRRRNYYLTVCIMAERFFEGKAYLTV